MASLQSRLSSLITAIGADIKALQARTPTVLSNASGPPLSTATSEPTKAVEWTYGPGGGMLAKIAGVNPASTSRGELWARVTNPTGLTVADRLILGNDGRSDFLPQIVSVLPTTNLSGGALFDGQECYLIVDSTTTVWHLKYSTGTTKWHFVGGPPLFSEVATAESPPSAGAFVPLATAGPSITVPIAGDYDVEIAFTGYASAAGNALRMSYDIGATAAVTTDQTLFETKVATPYTEVAMRKRRRTLAANTALVAKYQATNTASGPVFMYRTMKVTPVRLG